jgi:hypothetical protein
VETGLMRGRREQVHTAMPLSLGGGEGLERAQAAGYCLGLRSVDDLRSGRVVGHTGGYPGFGSRMVWSAECKVGVIGLANGRYPGGAHGVYETTLASLRAVVAAVPRRLAIEAHPAVARVRGAVDGALVRGDFTALLPLLSPNVDQDERLSRRAAVRSLPVPRTRASPQREKGRSRDGRSSPASAPRTAR